ncbi:heme biosynthesis protein HemY [Bartonella sp. F02]|uniref:heme biosynthesis protein HemY n=1 Tax=Bartonella sp. F02 TaxID=2967262 RepID=UPI0022A9A872|nr:heme biosynthesis HemY N-terminal domain-containing protein [Bartonella sp. F02]MCZ2327876.1 DNA-binding protein [Bartonella sp. F02]
MVRIFIYIFIVCILGTAFAWIANHNDVLVITFLHYRLTISLLTLLSAFIFLLGIFMLLWWFLGIVFSIPSGLSNYFYARQQKQGREALSRGFLAVFAGDCGTAQKMEGRALKYLAKNHEPLIKLLQAQILFLQKNSKDAIELYEEMRENSSTKLAGLYGLFREAMNAKAYDAAQQYAEEALSLSPALLWASQAVLDRLSAEGQWDKALEVFKKTQKTLPRAARFTEEHNRTYAVLLSGKALHLFDTHPVEARTAILQAHKLMPDFEPIITIAADILYQLKEVRKADKMIIKAWQKNPHPDLGMLYLEREKGAVGRLKKAKKLAAYNENAFESMFLIAKAALDAGELVLAKEQAQKALQIHPRESVYLLLADIEEVQGNDPGLVKKWLSLALRAERDPAWICEGTLFSSWAAVSPISGRLDCFEWKVPPRLPPVTLEAENIALKKEYKKYSIDKVVFIEDKPSEVFFPMEDEFSNEVQIEKQEKEIQDPIHLNVDNPGIKIEEDTSLSKKKEGYLKRKSYNKHY